jgi:hypothetical protein
MSLDLEILSGMQMMDDDMQGLGPLSAMMGYDSFNFAGDDDGGSNVLGELMGALMGRRGRRAQRAAAQHPMARQAIQAARGGFQLDRASGMNPTMPLNMVQPQIAGVADRGGRVQPLGFQNGAFIAAAAGGVAVVTVRARPQRPIRGGRVVGSYSRTGATATGLLTLVQLQVATDGQLLSGDPISFDALSPTAFGVGVNLTPAAVGNEITATVQISALPTGTDRIDFNLTLFGLTLG